MNGGHAEGSGPIRCLILALVAPTSPDRVAGLPLAAIGSSGDRIGLWARRCLTWLTLSNVTMPVAA